MFARYYYNLGCCCHTPVWLAARWISCCRVFPYHQAHSTGNVDHSTELHHWQAELQPGGMQDLISVDSLISFILEEGSFVSETNSCKNLCGPSALCLLGDAEHLRVGWGLEGGGAGSRGLPVQRADLVQKTRPAWCWGNALFGPKQVPFESEPPDGLCCRNGLFLQLCPQRYLQERLGWDHGSCTTAYLPCSPCLSVCIQTWAPGVWAQAEWLKDLAVYIMWPQPELFCCALQLVAFTLLALHLLGAHAMPPQSSYLFPAWGCCFQLDSRLKKGTLIFYKCQRLSAAFADVQKYRAAFLGGGRALMLRLRGGVLQPQLQTLRFLSRVST